MDVIYKLISLALEEPLVRLILLGTIFLVLGTIIRHFNDDEPKSTTDAPPPKDNVHWVGKADDEHPLKLPPPSKEG